MLQEGVQTQNVCVCMEGSMADAELYNKGGWALSYYNSNIVFIRNAINFYQYRWVSQIEAQW